MLYTEYLHRHNFAIWAAARATQRGFTTTKILKASLECSGIESYIHNFEQASDFDEKHKQWCRKICTYLENQEIQNVRYGRAAKLVNVYLKSMIVIPYLHNAAIDVVHPPIDRILLQNIAKQKHLAISQKNKKWLKAINWTQLDETEYFILIQLLREINGAQPFWMIEKYWNVTYT